MSDPTGAVSNPRLAAIRWLEEREPPAPFELQRRLVRAVERAPQADTMIGTLVEAAFASLANAMRIGDDRTAANDLLAADALITYAIEAAAEAGPALLDDLLNQLDLPRFRPLLSAAR